MATSSAAAPASIFLSFKLNPNPKLPFSLIKLPNSHSTPFLFSNPSLSPFQLKCASAVQNYAVDETPIKTQEEKQGEEEKRRKLFVVNLPWDFSAPDIYKLFGECGTVKDVEIIKKENRKNRGFAFVTMASGKEAQAVIEKFDNFEVMERIIGIEFAKSFKKPPPPPPTKEEGKYKIYASNLAWKVRSNNLRDIFTEKFNPVSARVVFDSPSGRSAGYGFVGFVTEEEAQAAVAELDGKELMGRALRLKVSQKTGDELGEELELRGNSE